MLCVPVQVEVGQPPVAGVELSDQTFLEIDPAHQTSQSQAQMHPGLVVGKKYWACWSHQMYLRKTILNVTINAAKDFIFKCKEHPCH